MKIIELHKILDEYLKRNGDKEYKNDVNVTIAIASPSIGRRAMEEVRGASFGFDWDSGTFILHPKRNLVRKTEKEAVWDLAHDYIYRLSLQRSPKGNPTSAAKWAREVLNMAKELTND